MNDSDQYHAFAADYEWLFSDTTLSGDPQIEELVPILTAFNKPRILDCACGTGLAALALARRGYEVLGTDQQQHGDAGTRTRGRTEAASAVRGLCLGVPARDYSEAR